MINSAAIVLVLATPALGDVSECAYNIGHHTAKAHSDLGGGFVSYEQSYLSKTDGSAQHIVENCRSGQRLITVMQDFGSDGPDRSKDVRAVFGGLAKSKEAFSFRDLKRRFEVLGAKSDIAKWNKQSCACVQAYPELRLGKEKYEAPPAS